MNLWDRDISPLESALGQLTLAERLAIGVKALENVLQTEQRPLEDEEAARWITAVLEQARRTVDAGGDSLRLPEELIDQYESLQYTVEEDGVPQLTLGMISCIDEDSADGEEGLEPSHLNFLLQSCYEFALQRQDPEPSTLEEEEENTRCRAVVAFQRELIEQAIS